MEVERVILERSFMCAPIGGRVGLSARTPREGGHCSNAGGLSAVRRDQLYSNRRIRVLAIGTGQHVGIAVWPHRVRFRSQSFGAT